MDWETTRGRNESPEGVYPGSDVVMERGMNGVWVVDGEWVKRGRRKQARTDLPTDGG